MSDFIVDEAPQLYQPTVAKVVGLNEAIFLQQLKYWLNRSNHYHEDRLWVYNSQNSWAKQFPFWSRSTLQRTIANLQERQIIICGYFNSSRFDRTKWYTLDEAKLRQIIDDYLDKANAGCLEMQAVDEIPLENAKLTSCDSGNLTTSDCRKMSEPIPENTKDNQSEDDYARVVKPPMTENDKLAQVIKVYSDNIHPVTGSIEADKLLELLERYGAETVIKAIELAVSYNARTLSYITKVLNSWHNYGFKGHKKSLPSNDRIPSHLRELEL